MIRIINGNLFDADAKIICHQCNCQGVMGSGIAAEVRRRYPEVYEQYKSYCTNPGANLGDVLLVRTKANREKMIANLFAQDKYGRDKQYTNYEAFRKCLKVINSVMKEETMDGSSCKVAFPYKIGCGLGGGDWNRVYKIIEEEVGEYEVEIWKL